MHIHLHLAYLFIIVILVGTYKAHDEAYRKQYIKDDPKKKIRSVSNAKHVGKLLKDYDKN